MKLKNKNIVFCLTGSFFTFKSIILQINKLIEEKANIIPIMSYNAYNTNTKLGKAKDYIKEIENLTGKRIIHSMNNSQLIGSKIMSDILIIAPCTGNTLSKVTIGICDSPVLMALKSHLRYCKPVVIAPITNDGLSVNAENIGKLLNRNNYFFVPFKQDNPITKPRSIAFKPDYIKETLEYALDGKQIQPILL